MTRHESAVFLQAADMFADLCEHIGDDQWDRPALGEWDVRALVGHCLRAVTTVSSYLARPEPDAISCRSAGEYFVLVKQLPGADDRAVADRGHQAGRELGSEPSDTVRDAVTRAREALASTSEDRRIDTVVGGMSLRSYLPTRTFELVAHSLDLAAATGLGLDPPAAVVESATQTAVAALVRRGDGVALFRHLIGRPGGAHRPLFE